MNENQLAEAFLLTFRIIALALVAIAGCAIGWVTFR
jgi:hypothetical protein